MKEIFNKNSTLTDPYGYLGKTWCMWLEIENMSDRVKGEFQILDVDLSLFWDKKNMIS